MKSTHLLQAAHKDNFEPNKSLEDAAHAVYMNQHSNPEELVLALPYITFQEQALLIQRINEHPQSKPEHLAALCPYLEKSKQQTIVERILQIPAATPDTLVVLIAYGSETQQPRLIARVIDHQQSQPDHYVALFDYATEIQAPLLVAAIGASAHRQIEHLAKALRHATAEQMPSLLVDPQRQYIPDFAIGNILQNLRNQKARHATLVEAISHHSASMPAHLAVALYEATTPSQIADIFSHPQSVHITGDHVGIAFLYADQEKRQTLVTAITAKQESPLEHLIAALPYANSATQVEAVLRHAKGIEIPVPVIAAFVHQCPQFTSSVVDSIIKNPLSPATHLHFALHDATATQMPGILNHPQRFGIRFSLSEWVSMINETDDLEKISELAAGLVGLTVHADHTQLGLTDAVLIQQLTEGTAPRRKQIIEQIVTDASSPTSQLAILAQHAANDHQFGVIQSISRHPNYRGIIFNFNRAFTDLANTKKQQAIITGILKTSITPPHYLGESLAYATSEQMKSIFNHQNGSRIPREPLTTFLGNRPELRAPIVAAIRSSARCLSTIFLRGITTQYSEHSLGQPHRPATVPQR